MPSPANDLQGDTRPARVFDLLLDIYPRLRDWPGGDWPISGCFHPRRLEVVVGAILTQNTRWSNVEKVLPLMIKDGLVSAESLSRGPSSRLERSIRSAGVFRQKARRLKRVARFILDYRGDFYARVTREELLAINGIGDETADSILLYACDRPQFVVDAYARRIFSRYGLVECQSKNEEIKRFFESRLPPDVSLYKRYHALIVAHAKTACKKLPLCNECGLQDECRYQLATAGG